MRAIDYIVVHTAAAYDADERRVVHQSFETVKRYHMMPKAERDAAGKLVPGTGGRGFRDIGYHRYIEVTGKIRLGRLDAEQGAHVEKFNQRTLGVCCSGHGDYEAFNRAQLDSLVAQCAAWCRLYGLSFERVIGHTETELHGGPHVPKNCPGKLIDMAMIRARVRDELAGVPRGMATGEPDDEPPPTRREGRGRA